jgi:hypothetical protein
MQVRNIPVQEGSLEFLQKLFEDSNKKIHGVYYTNDFFSQRYLCRSHISKDVTIEDNTLKITIPTRLENVGLLEIENTLDVLVQHEAGDLPGYTYNGENLAIPEPVSVNQYLFAVDMFLILKDPTVSYQLFNIADSKFHLVNIDHKLGEGEDEFNQTITLLFGAADKLYFFSHFYNKELSESDKQIMLDLVMDGNITGKAIVAAKVESSSGASTGIFPMDKLISAYRGAGGDYTLGGATGYVKIPQKAMQGYKLELIPVLKTGSYTMNFIGENETVRIYFE